MKRLTFCCYIAFFSALALAQNLNAYTKNNPAYQSMMLSQDARNQNNLNEPVQLEPVPQADNHSTKPKSRDDQFSELAFSNSANVTDTLNGSNLSLRSDKEFGAVLLNDMPVFGTNLFSNQCHELKKARFLNPNYRLSIGDKVNVQIWGAFEFSKEMTIDTQGNIFLPEVGPVKLAGIENKQLNDVLKARLKQVFLKDVHIYGDLITAQPVQVYVTGYVSSPGLYDGLSSDSVIYYLCRAGGINSQEGSFRQINVVRNKKVIHRIDLYEFILHGDIEHFQLHQGDTVVVGPLKYSITATGNVKNNYRYEFIKPSIRMTELINVVNPDATVTHVRVLRRKGTKPSLDYIPIRDARRLLLNAGDSVSFVSDQEVRQVMVTVTGELQGKHQFVMESGASLADLLKKLRFTREADAQNIQLYRESVAKQQKAAVDSSLSRLERQILTTSSVTADGARIQAFQSQMIMKFISEAKSVEFQGQVVLGDRNQWHKIHLQNNDVVNIPRKTSVVTVSGDVLNSLSIESNPRFDYLDYIKAAGGFANTGDRNKVLLVHQNGRIEILTKQLFGRRHQIRGGDQIIVLPKVQTENWQVTESLSRILYQIAVAARVALVV